MSVTIQSLGPAGAPVKGADVASAGTVTLTSGSFQHITGTTTITDVDFDTAANGAWAWVTFDGALTLTYNATTLKLPGSANILTQAGDTALFVQDSGDNVICLVYNRVQAGKGAPKEAAVASAGTTVLKAGAFQHITGTTTITDIDFDSANDGNWAWVVFDGALTLTHNATTLILPGGANITTAAGDRALFVQDSGDNVYCIAYVPANGLPLDSDLVTIAGLTATTDNFIQSKSSAWASRTPTQVTADLIAVVGDSGSGGTKGLVPAPAAGDAAAAKFLKADGTWAAPSSGGMTLLGTLTTTSGTTQSLTGIAAGYEKLYIEIDGVSFSGNITMTLALSSTNGAAYGTSQTIAPATGGAAASLQGYIEVGNISSTGQVCPGQSYIGAGNPPSVASVTITNANMATNTAAVVNAIRFAGGTFDAGTIRIYGVK